jgi:hypothetical protein
VQRPAAEIPGPPSLPEAFAVVLPPDTRVLAATVMAAAGTDLALRSGVACLAGTLLVPLASAGLRATEVTVRVPRRRMTYRR